MNLPKNYFQNLSAERYREYLKLLPGIEQENTKMFVTLSLTLSALIFFGVFAINPTVTTISELKKEVEDNTQVEMQLQTKIQNLSALNQQYGQLSTDLSYVDKALPKDPQAPLLSAQIAAIAKQDSIEVTSYRVAEVLLAANKNTFAKNPSFIFTLQATGQYDNMLAFTSDLANLNRIVTLESMNITRDPKSNDLVLTLRGRQYFKP